MATPKIVTYYKVTANGIEIDTHDNCHNTYEKALKYWKNELSHLPNTTYGILKITREKMVGSLK